MNTPELFEITSIRIDTPATPAGCEYVVCKEQATQWVAIHYCEKRTTYRMRLCDRHEQLLHDAHELLGFMMDIHDDQEWKRESEIAREAKIEDWARVFVQAAAAAALGPDTLAKKAYEFAHAMIGRKEIYDRALSYKESEERRARPELGYGRLTYFHHDDLLKVAEEDGRW